MSTNFEITLADLRKAGACIEGYNKLVCHLQGKPFDEAAQDRDSYIRYAHKDPVSLLTVLDNNGLDDALWCLRLFPQHDRLWRLYAVWCAKQVQHLMTDQRSLNALDVAERYANGEATEAQLAAARDAALDAARDAARDAALDAALGAALGAARGAARGAALDAARDAARDAAWDAAWAAAWAAAWGAARDAAWGAAWDAAWAAAWAAARGAQHKKFREVLMTGAVTFEKQSVTA